MSTTDKNSINTNTVFGIINEMRNQCTNINTECDNSANCFSSISSKAEELKSYNGSFAGESYENYFKTDTSYKYYEVYQPKWTVSVSDAILSASSNFNTADITGAVKDFINMLNNNELLIEQIEIEINNLTKAIALTSGGIDAFSALKDSIFLDEYNAAKNTNKATISDNKVQYWTDAPLTFQYDKATGAYLILQDGVAMGWTNSEGMSEYYAKLEEVCINNGTYSGVTPTSYSINPEDNSVSYEYEDNNEQSINGAVFKDNEITFTINPTEDNNYLEKTVLKNRNTEQYEKVNYYSLDENGIPKHSDQNTQVVFKNYHVDTNEWGIAQSTYLGRDDGLVSKTEINTNFESEGFDINQQFYGRDEDGNPINMDGKIYSEEDNIENTKYIISEEEGVATKSYYNNDNGSWIQDDSKETETGELFQKDNGGYDIITEEAATPTPRVDGGTSDIVEINGIEIQTDDNGKQIVIDAKDIQSVTEYTSKTNRDDGALVLSNVNMDAGFEEQTIIKVDGTIESKIIYF